MAAKLIGERLPQNWSYGVARDGRIFFVDDGSQSTTWLHPLTGQPVQTGYQFNDGLPPGWEQALTVEGAIYFIDHNNRRTTFEHPVTGRSPIKDSSVRSPQSPDIKPSPHRKSTKSKNIKAPSASRGENSKVIMRGWLQKQESGGLRLWKRKWCVLADFGLFFYKDDSEQTAIGSILLPSYRISPCSQNELNKKYAFKAEHENMKTYYFAADNQPAMEQWVDALRMASQLQRAPGSSSMDLPKLVPKSPIMTWNEDLESPDATPREAPQFPYGDPNASRDSFRDRSPLQQRQNTQPLRNPYEQDGLMDQQQRYPNEHRGVPNDRVDQGQMDRSRDPRLNQPGYFDDRGSLRDSQRSGSHGYNPSGDYGTLAYDSQGQVQGQMNVPYNRMQGRPPDDVNHSMDNRYPSDRLDQSRLSQRSIGQGQPSLPEDQRSNTSTASYPRQMIDQYSTSSLPRGHKNGSYDPRAEPRAPSSSGSFRGQGQGPQNYNSLPREPRHHDAVSRSGRQGQRRDGPTSQSPPGRYGGRRDDKNPYMVMSSPQSSMDETSRPLSTSRHSNRPLPQQPQEPPRPPGSQTGGGDYASLTRYNRDKPRYQDQQQQQQQPDLHSPNSTHSNQSPERQKPDLYVDIPHTYVNVYDSSQVRDEPPELPSRPPLPVEMRHMIVEDIAQNRTPNTQNDILTAERNLELRMQQPAYFDYPTPRQTDSPRSQKSQGTQRPRQPVPTPRGQQKNRPDLAPPRRDHRGNLPDRNMNAKFDSDKQNNDLEGSDDTLTNEDKKSEMREGFYSLGRYSEKVHSLSRHPSSPERKNRFMSDMDVRTQTLPSKPRPGDTGEKDFRLRSLPDHVQSMPSIYHEQTSMPPVVEQGRQPSAGSYMNLSPPSIASDSKLLVGDENEDPNQRKSAFRPLSSASRGSNSLQRLSSVDGSVKSYPTPSHPEAQLKHAGYFDPDRMDLRKAAPMSQVPTQQSTWQPQSESLPIQPQMNGNVGAGRGWDRGQRAPAIHTVKEDPNMPDSDVIETELPQRVFPLNGPRLRMSISAGDLLGKTHDELVLLLIQLRRDKADLTEQRNDLRKTIEQGRPAEFRYRKLQNEGQGRIDQSMETEHQRYMDTKHRCEEIEKKLEVYKPIVNLVCNMVTMGSLYGGDNLMLATEYRKHLLSPDQYSPPKKMLEFSRKQQEDTIVKEIEDDVKQLTQDEADLEEKLDRLYDLDRMIQEQSFQVTSLKEDRELLEKALGGLLKKQDENCTNARELDKLIQQQRTIERELSRVLQQLAEASKELEETTAECNRVEHEVALLRSKVHGDMSRSRSAPSLSNESLRTKMKMEKDLAKVKNIMEGLSKEGARLQEVMTTLRKAAPGVVGTDKPILSSSHSKDGKKSSNTTYYETDMDTNESKDLAAVTALLASYQLAPSSASISQSPPGFQPLTSEIANKYNSQPRPSGNSPGNTYKMSSPTSTFHASPLQSGANNLDSSQLETDTGDQWDIGDADDNTKKFYGLIPRNMPKTTVRDVKHRSEQRREERKKEDDPPLRVGVIPSHPDYTDSAPVYENLPQPNSSVISPVKPWTAILSDSNTPSATERRRSNLQLMAPKPYTPYNAQSQPQSQNIQSFTGIQAENPPQGFSRTPPPPPVRGQKLIQPESSSQSYSSAPFSMTSALNGHVSPQGQMSPQGQRSPHSPRRQDLLKVPAWEKPIPRNKGRIIGPRRSANKGRYLTISSSQPIKLEKEKTSPQSPKLYSQAGDLISSSDVPDIIKSSTARIENFDEDTIDREILYMPEKVVIPERYMPDSDDEDLSPVEKAIRQEKAEKIKRILTQQSVHSLSQPDVSKVAGEVHERVQQEKLMRAQLLGIGQELAEQVKKKSRQYAAERRKTWSGTPSKSDEEKQDTSSPRSPADDSFISNHSDANNNSYGNELGQYDSRQDPYNRNYDDYLYDKHVGTYADDTRDNYAYSKGDHSYLPTDSFSYHKPNYTATSYMSRPNFKI